MSRSNPNVNSPNPSTRWFEWDGSKGGVRYYDKDAEKNIELALPFVFLVLDETSTIKGWHDPSDSGIYSNEVRDLGTQPLTVKSFKGGVLANGLYKDIKDKAKAKGGMYVSNIYLGFKEAGNLQIGCLQLKGASVHRWMEFRKKAGKELLSSAVSIYSTEKGKKGKIEFVTPVFKLVTVSPETNEAAIALDKELQEFFKDYFARSNSTVPSEVVTEEDTTGGNYDEHGNPEPEPEPEIQGEYDEVPF